MQTSFPVSDEPSYQLESWGIRQLPDGELHLLGVDPLSKVARVSSTVVEFDKVKRTGITSSGRVYSLLGQSRYDKDVQALLVDWCIESGINIYETEDVSFDRGF